MLRPLIIPNRRRRRTTRVSRRVHRLKPPVLLRPKHMAEVPHLGEDGAVVCASEVGRGAGLLGEGGCDGGEGVGGFVGGGYAVPVVKFVVISAFGIQISISEKVEGEESKQEEKKRAKNERISTHDASISYVGNILNARLAAKIKSTTSWCST